MPGELEALELPGGPEVFGLPGEPEAFGLPGEPEALALPGEPEVERLDLSSDSDVEPLIEAEELAGEALAESFVAGKSGL